MAAATATFQHSYGLGPRGPESHYRAQQDQGPHHHPPSAPGPSGGAPRPEEQQQHHKPFFYIQPSQPYMPMQSMQWPVPVPVPYNPYYPGLGECLKSYLEILKLCCVMVFRHRCTVM